MWKAISPVRTINAAFAKLSGSDPDAGVFTYPARLGYWPAALGLFAFVWLELVYPYSTELGPVRLWCAVYVAAMLIGGALFGSTFYERARPVRGLLHAGRAAVGLGPAGRASWWSAARWPTSTPRRSRPAWSPSTSVLFGSTAFDSFKDSSRWIQFIQGDRPTPRPWPSANNLALLAFCVGVGLIFAVGTMLTGVGPDSRAASCRTSSRTRSCRSSSATSSPTT